MNIKAVFDLAPPTPACFASRTAWSEFLFSAQQAYPKPFVKGVFRPSFNFCSDCPSDFKAGMAAANKCHPSMFRILLRVKEAA